MLMFTWKNCLSINNTDNDGFNLKHVLFLFLLITSDLILKQSHRKNKENNVTYSKHWMHFYIAMWAIVLCLINKRKRFQLKQLASVNCNMTLIGICRICQ